MLAKIRSKPLGCLNFRPCPFTRNAETAYSLTAPGKNADGIFLAREFVIHNSGPKTRVPTLLFKFIRARSPRMQARSRARDYARDAYMMQARLRNERVLLFNPLKLFRIITLVLSRVTTLRLFRRASLR